ncbi:fumarylacetoacetate hydrolase family protein [Pigmentiphaga kullae]|uniref:Fumarylacetoacetate (FAA) hydrolase n=1 Tax=Pigmentiphaga kullae TaxID=151784 RepID=A0A4Q7NEB7_9BURK|nr:fumarylacetoacetate hydrolase family protein [Pigmentiphaga kullae]RZS81333.1 fumarylacetoacetate (FAA) hydrolase [Pigmentiphaga kullae]
MKAGQYPLRLATLADGSRDGQLVLVRPDLQGCVPAGAIARSLQDALDDWEQAAPRLDALRARHDEEGWRRAEPFLPGHCMAPLPRAYQWADASVYRNHARLIYQWRKEPIPPRYEEIPLVYQGGSDVMLSATEDIVAADAAQDIDLEAEIAVVTTDVPMGVDAARALDHIALVVLLNDVSLRGLIPGEVARGFGFYQGKPATSFAPVAVTPAALGEAWRGAMADLRVRVRINGAPFGDLRSGEEAVFHFGQIIAHLAATRALGAGTIVGAGTISNADPAAGSACITEARVRQMLDGVPEAQLHPYLDDGDRVNIEAVDARGRSVFGAIDQRVRIAANRN